VALHLDDDGLNASDDIQIALASADGGRAVTEHREEGLTEGSGRRACRPSADRTPRAWRLECLRRSSRRRPLEGGRECGRGRGA
jgi:hypothetical protein